MTPAYRTAIFLFLLSLVGLVAISVNPTAPLMESFCWLLGMLAFAQAGKSGIEHVTKSSLMDKFKKKE